MATKTEAVHAQAHLFERASVELQRSCQEQSAPEVSSAIANRGWAFLKVSGKSMFPWIRHGDIIFVRHAVLQNVVSGDVVVFERNSTLCVHRVLSQNPDATALIAGGALITKGDATADADAPVFADELRGRVEFIYRRNREIQIARGWRKYFGKLLAVISPAVPWWRPIATMVRDTARCEFHAVAQRGIQRSAENSAD